jgi:hypothetical protein
MVNVTRNVEAAGKTEVVLLTATDLHQNKELYSDLVKAVERHHLDLVALVGDFLHAGQDLAGRASVAEARRHLPQQAAAHDAHRDDSAEIG